MPIDPNLWGNMPGQGRAPLQPAYQPSQAASNPMADIARRLIQSQGGEGRTLPGDMPAGSLARNPVGVPPDALRAELVAGGGLEPGMGQGAMTRGPGTIAGLLAGIPGLGPIMGGMGQSGQKQQMRDVSRELGHERLQARPGTQMAAALGDDPYERGRQAARTMVASNQGGDGGRGGREQQHDRSRETRDYNESRGGSPYL